MDRVLLHCFGLLERLGEYENFAATDQPQDYVLAGCSWKC